MGTKVKVKVKVKVRVEVEVNRCKSVSTAPTPKVLGVPFALTAVTDAQQSRALFNLAPLKTRFSLVGKREASQVKIFKPKVCPVHRVSTKKRVSCLLGFHVNAATFCHFLNGLEMFEWAKTLLAYGLSFDLLQTQVNARGHCKQLLCAQSS